MWTAELLELSARVGQRLESKGWRLVTAESCTGGALAALITEVAGSSHWFERGFVTYANLAKEEMLGVHPNTLQVHGAVSEAVVTEMAQGALKHSQAEVAVAISGIAGPGGGSAEKPVGTVCIAWAVNGLKTQVETFHFAGNRAAIRLSAIKQSLTKLEHIISVSQPPGGF